MRICVPVSGSATNLEAILAAGIKPDLVIVDRECRGEQVATDNHLPLVRIYRKSFQHDDKLDRPRYTQAFVAQLQAHHIDLIPMAGFMTILGDGLFEQYAGRLINLHPSLFTGMFADYPGGNAVADALAAGAVETGSTIHLATQVLDAGPVLGSTSVRVFPDDDKSSLHERMKKKERMLYPDVIKRIMAGKIDLDALWQEWLVKQKR